MVKSVQQGLLLFGHLDRVLSTPHRAVECIAAVCCTKTVSFELLQRVRSLRAGIVAVETSPSFAAPSTDAANDRP
jgi:hypothetical protein